MEKIEILKPWGNLLLENSCIINKELLEKFPN